MDKNRVMPKIGTFAASCLIFEQKWPRRLFFSHGKQSDHCEKCRNLLYSIGMLFRSEYFLPRICGGPWIRKEPNPMPSFTRKAIMQSFLKLVDQRPINKVTIKDIVEDCGINRNTFYYHFSDIPALIEAIVQEEAAELFQTHPTITSYEECIRLAIQEIQKNRRAVLHIYNSSNRDIYEHYLMQMCQYIVETYFNTLLGDKKINRQDREIIVTVYSCQCFGLFIDWLNNNLSDEFPQRVERLCELRKGMLEEMLERCGEE